MWAAIGYRRAQAVVIALLSALLAACAVFSPLYQRALEQAVVRSELARLPDGASNLSLSSDSTQPSAVAGAGTLVAAVPTELRRWFEAPVESMRASLAVASGRGTGASGTLRYRQDQCSHLVFTSGSCPLARNEVAVSAADADANGWSPGQPIAVREVTSTRNAVRPVKTLTVSGIYRQQPGPYWAGLTLTGRSGTADANGTPQLDALVPSRPTMDGPAPPSDLDLATAGSAQVDGLGWNQRGVAVDLSLRPAAVSVEGIASVAAGVRALSADLARTASYAVQVRSAVPTVAEAVLVGREQAQVTTPLLMGQLGLLAVVVLRLVLGAAVEQRRPDVALARLRGSGSASARRLLLRELGFVVLLGMPVGVLVALAVAWLARHTWLVAGVPFEVPRTAYLALAVAALLALATTWLVVRPVSAEPVSALLRRVPARRSGWRLGLADAVVVAVAVTGVVGVWTGNLAGPMALLTPSLVALAVGLVLAHTLVPAAARAGRRLMSGGRVRGGLTALQMARRPAVRRVVTVVTLASALVVFAGEAMVVGARNREARAQQETGAPVVLETGRGSSISTVRSVLAGLDLEAGAATPVVTVSQAGSSGSTTVAVEPEAFSRVAFFPGVAKGSIDWAALAPPAAPLLRVTGRQLTAQVKGLDIVTTDGSPTDASRRPRLGVVLIRDDGTQTVATLGALPFGAAGPEALAADVPCQDGCSLVALTVEGALASPVPTRGRFIVSDIAADGSDPLPVGRADSWATGTSAGVGGRESMQVAAAPTAGSVEVGYDNSTTLLLSMRHASSPLRLPALVAGTALTAGPGLFQAAGLDGVSRQLERVGAVPFLPRSPTDSALVNLDVLLRDGARQSELSTTAVWVGRDDPALVARITRALESGGVVVASVSRASQAEQAFADSAAAWSLNLALIAGLAAVTIAALVILLAVTTSWRQRAADLAALRLAGVRQRDIRAVAVAEQLVVVVLAVLAGTLSGLAGAWLALRSVPMFSTTSPAPSLDVSVSWPALALAGVGCLLVLAVVGGLVGAGLGRRCRLSLVREQV